MGNRLCKNKRDAVDNAKNVRDVSRDKSPSKFDRIINRLHLKPTAWKSESHLNKNRSKSEERNKNGESIFYTKPLSKSSDWTEVDLEVPSKEDDHIHLRNPQLNLIFDNENNGTPTPPPRKQQKPISNFREKFERIASKGLQAFQSDKNKDPPHSPQVPVEEPLMVKRKINYNCPLCDSDEKGHNRDHHHPNANSIVVKNADGLKTSKNTNKRLKNLSVVSLPNYTDLKLSVAHPDDINNKKTASKNDLNSSRLSLQHPGHKKITSSQSTGKLDSYITRCRSFGSIFPQQLKKLRMQKTISNKPEDITSDDSFGPLEDWDVGLIEHYNPKDASLPRPRKPAKAEKSREDVLKGIEGLIVKEEDIIEAQKPKRPVRELVKKMNEQVPKPPEDICLTPPPSPDVHVGRVQVVGSGRKVAALSKNFEESASVSAVEPKRLLTNVVRRSRVENVAAKADDTKRESVAEHSSLMRILQEFSIKDKQEKDKASAAHHVVENDSNLSSLTPSLVEFEKTLSNSLTEDFINAERSHSKAVCS